MQVLLAMHVAVATVYGKTFEWENFPGCAQNTPFTGKLLRCIRPWPSCNCTQQVTQGENFRDWLKNHENCKSFPTRKFCHIRYHTNNIAILSARKNLGDINFVVFSSNLPSTKSNLLIYSAKCYSIYYLIPKN